MSYMNALRLHFFGQFQSNVSTVNNDPGHYDNAIFKPSYQAMQGANMRPPNGWFNPQGDAAFRLLGCAVTAAWTPAGQVTDDPVLQMIVADSDGSAPAKLVDLDPEQQLVSQIWGLEVRIADANGNTIVSGQYLPAAFMDIWDRATGSGGGDTTAGAYYQSVLTDLVWGDIAASPFLTALQQASAATGLLSIKFNVDGMNLDYTSPEFMCGRICGPIGPVEAAEPNHMLIGRQFMATASPNGNFFTPVGGINFCAGVVDEAASAILLDLGNALSTTTPGGPFNDLGDLTLQAYSPLIDPTNPAGSLVPVGTIPAQGASGYIGDANWYAQTAGLVSVPLDADQLNLVATSRLVLTGAEGAIISEWPSAAYVRADNYVARLNPGEEATFDIYAMQYGRPLAGATIDVAFDPSQLQDQNSPIFVTKPPKAATPADAITYPASLVSDANGLAALVVGASDPGTPRLFANSDYGIDGQVYGLRPSFADAALQGPDDPVNQWNFISLLVWSGWTPGDPVTWTDLQPVFQQYANLYPVMVRFLNLADYDAVRANADLLSLAFALPLTDPNSMPVTRDLSLAKRSAILSWLQNPLPGIAPPTSAAPTSAPPPDGKAAAAAPTPEPEIGPIPPGGKAAAVARRRILEQR